MSADQRLEALTELLRASDDDRLVLPLTFIEDLTGEPLPASAHRYGAWWSNTAGHAGAWLDAGYRTSRSDVGPGEVAFVRDDGRRAAGKRRGRGRPRAYEPLRDHLAAQSRDVIELTYTEIEEILERPLPDSAYVHAAFWSNSSVIAYAWRDAGFRASRAGLAKNRVRFVRTDSSEVVASAEELLAGLHDTSSTQVPREPHDP